MKFMLMVCIAFFARVNPVSTSANPACMNMTRKPVTSSHTKLTPSRFWSIEVGQLDGEWFLAPLPRRSRPG